jgi:hypothetical protein
MPATQRTLSGLAEVQRVALIVLDGEFPHAPGGVVHALHEADALVPERGGERSGIVGLEIEMEVLPRRTGTTLYSSAAFTGSVTRARPGGRELVEPAPAGTLDPSTGYDFARCTNP